MKCFLAVVLLTLNFPAMCGDVIDLGSIEIDGETRRPMISYSESSLNLTKALSHQLKSSANSYVTNLNSEKMNFTGPGEFSFSKIEIKDVELDFTFSPLLQGI